MDTKKHLIAFYSCSCNQAQTAKGRAEIIRKGKCACGAVQYRLIPSVQTSEPFQYGGDMIEAF